MTSSVSKTWLAPTHERLPLATDVYTQQFWDGHEVLCHDAMHAPASTSPDSSARRSTHVALNPPSRPSSTRKSRNADMDSNVRPSDHWNGAPPPPPTPSHPSPPPPGTPGTDAQSSSPGRVSRARTRSKLMRPSRLVSTNQWSPRCSG